MPLQAMSQKPWTHFKWNCSWRANQHISPYWKL